MKQVKRSQVPKAYRKDYKKILLEFGGTVLSALLFDAIVLLIILG